MSSEDRRARSIFVYDIRKLSEVLLGRKLSAKKRKFRQWKVSALGLQPPDIAGSRRKQGVPGPAAQQAGKYLEVTFSLPVLFARKRAFSFVRPLFVSLLRPCFGAVPRARAGAQQPDLTSWCAPD